MKAVAKHRFKIERVLHRALEGLILTTEITLIDEVNTDADVALSQSEKFKALKAAGLDFCKLQIQQTISPTKISLLQQKIEQFPGISSAVELSYFCCMMLTTPTKTDLQSILDQNDIEARMTTVLSFMVKEK